MPKGTNVNQTKTGGGDFTLLPPGAAVTQFYNPQQAAKAQEYTEKEIKDDPSILDKVLANIFEYNLEHTVHSQMGTVTVSNTGGTNGFNGNMTFNVSVDIDMLTSVTMVSSFPALVASSEPSMAGFNYPVWYTISDPLSHADETQVQETFGTRAKWLSATYGAAPDTEESEFEECAPPVSKFVAYVTSVGLYVFDSISMAAGTVVFEKMVAPAIAGLDALFGDATDYHIESWGAYQTTADSIRASALAQTFYVVVPFGFSRAPALAFPVVASIFSAPNIQVKTNSMEQLVVRSDRTVLPANAATRAPLSTGDLTVHARYKYVIFDDNVRAGISKKSFSKLYTELTVQESKVTAGHTDEDITVKQAGFMLAIFIMVQREKAVHLNMHSYYGGLYGMDALTNVTIKAGSTTLLDSEARPLRIVEPEVCQGTHVPFLPVYMTFFCVDPFGEAVSGVINSFVVRDVKLTLTFQPGLMGEVMMVYIMVLNATFMHFKSSAVTCMYRK